MSENQLELVQGSKEWYEARIGKCTSSNFGKVMTRPQTKKDRENGVLSATAKAYMAQIIGERLTNRPAEEIKSKYLDWGNEHEPTARGIYQFKFGGNLKQVGFVNHPEISMVGGSPDCLIDDDGVMEIKCPYTVANHIATMEKDEITDKAYQWQCQGNMWVTGRKWLDFVSFHPLMPPEMQLHAIRVERDEDMIEDLEIAIEKFMDELERRLSKIQKARETVQ